MNSTFRVRFLAITAVLVLVAFAAPASATHSWNGYHWARTANPFTIRVIDSMTSDWDDNLNTAIADWDRSTVLNVTREAGDSGSQARRRCAAVRGKVRSCNASYGNTGWLGLAQIALSNGHIAQGTAKMNDTYLAGSSYNETNRQQVICQEIGHDWGLDHQDDTGRDLNTCMDYADALDNPAPNAHDYDQLVSSYGHTDSTSTIAALPAEVANADLDTKEKWGKSIKKSKDGKTEVFERDFGDGNKVLTFVTWAETK